MIPSDGVTNKRQRLSPDQFEKEIGLEEGKVAAVGLPLPPEVLGVGPPELHAVLVLLDTIAGLVGVVRALRIPHPLARK